MSTQTVDYSEVSIWAMLRASLGLSLIGFLLCGLLYSGVATALAQWLFPEQANGSLLYKNGQVVGSLLVAQSVVQDKYFIGRPSAVNNDPVKMSGSNLAETNPELQQQIQQRQQLIAKREQVAISAIPADLLTSSGSGIDPDISVAGALIQAKRIAQVRSLPESTVIHLIQQHVQHKTWQVLGQAHVNVLQLNLTLDQLNAGHP